MKKNTLFFILFGNFIYLEIAFKLIHSLSLFDISTYFVILFTCLFSIILYLLISLFKRKGQVIVTSIILFIFSIYYSAHTCLYSIYKFYFQMSQLALADQVGKFASDGISVVVNNAPYILIFFLPSLLFIFVFRRFIDKQRINIKLTVILTCLTLIFYLPFALDSYGYVNKVFASNNMIQVVNKNGVLSGLFYDISKIIKGDDFDIDVIEPQEDIIDNNDDIEYGYNGFNIDFESLNEKTSNQDIVKLNNYFANITPSKKNEYTSFFGDKNLILFMAESFNGIAVNKDLTPTLYKLVHSGFEFNNFYTPTNYSTIGGEFCELTSLFPDLTGSPNTLSIFRGGINEYPMGIGNVFKDKGYNTYAYHDSSYDFQDRNVYLNSLGFDHYNACGLGLEKEISCRYWPASDVEMIDATFDDYISDDKFCVFYASVSGHGPYVFDKENNIIAPNYKEQIQEYFKDRLGSGNNASMLMAYQAGQMELDRALEELLNKLDAAGKLDDTVIALVGDHHPYYLTDAMSMDDYNKLSTYERDEEIELYHSNFILYNSAMDTVTIDKVGSQLDVIPTLYNLFGIDFDSRLLMGNDLLSKSTSIAIMGDNSWVNDLGRYYANSQKYESNSDIGMSDSYVSMINKKITNMQSISKLIMKTNYYKFVYDNK